MSARARVEAAIQQASREVVGLPELQQVASLLDAGFTAMAKEFDVMHEALTVVVRLLNGPVSEEAQEAQDTARKALEAIEGAP